MSKRFLLAVAILAASLAAAEAQTAKAPAFLPASDPCTVATASTPLSCSGRYIGGAVAGQGSNVDIIASGINGSVFAGGMTPTFVAGYQYAKGNWFFAGEGDAGYSVKTGVAANGVGNSYNGFRFTELVKVGGNLSALLGTQAPITIPPQLAAAVLSLYAHLGQTQWQLPGAWANGLTSGAGLVYDIGPKWFGDLRYTYTNFNSAKAGGVTLQNDQSLMAGLNYKF
jgi:opacity protein-like surface antigen